MEALHRQNPEHVEFALDLGEALDKRATCRLESRDSARAEQDLQRSMAILDPTFRANPRNLTALRNLADCHRGFGDLAASRSDWKKAGIEYQKSLDLWDRWKEVGTSSVYDQRRRDDAALLVARATKQSLQPSPAR
jgi:tetratricopeptide (TPR) repeat protein